MLPRASSPYRRVRCPETASGTTATPTALICRGLLLPRDRNKTLTALAGAEPAVTARAGAVQRLQFFLSESTWDPEAINTRRLALLLSDPATVRLDLARFRQETGSGVGQTPGRRQQRVQTSELTVRQVRQISVAAESGTGHPGGKPA
jgi:DDE superfamily endonuclease